METKRKEHSVERLASCGLLGVPGLHTSSVTPMISCNLADQFFLARDSKTAMPLYLASFRFQDWFYNDFDVLFRSLCDVRTCCH